MSTNFEVTLAYCFALILSKYFLRDNFLNIALERPNAKSNCEELMQKSAWRAITFIGLIRLSPVMTFAATNLLLAASRVKTGHFLLESLIELSTFTLTPLISLAFRFQASNLENINRNH